VSHRVLHYRGGLEYQPHREDEKANKAGPRCLRIIYHETMLYFIDTGVNSSHSHILTVSDSAPHANGAEVPIAGAHVLLEGQGVGADRHKPREDARMTMYRLSFARLRNEQEDPLTFFPASTYIALLCSSCDLSASQVLRSMVYVLACFSRFDGQLKISKAKRSH
jgi:hypothetical protein